MKVYLVGGAVRDKLLGLPVREKDWVVVGASVNDMLNKGFRQVGKEFPVFLHPKTREEYALARVERKIGAGYKGFAFESSPRVSLKDDLIRRDLTINAMAESEDGELIDPYHGKIDLEKKILRHVSPAFAEDPVRILRIGRFLARYAGLGFSIAPETLKLMRDMVSAGEVDALVPERVWKELQRALTEAEPVKFFEALDACGAFSRLFPGLNMNDAGMKALQQTQAPAFHKDAAIRFAVLLHAQSEDSIKMICHRYRVPNEYRELALLTSKYHLQAFKIKTLPSEQIFALLSRLDCFRRNQRFQRFVNCCTIIADTKKQTFDASLLEACAEAAKSIDIKNLVSQGLIGTDLANKIKSLRIKKISDCL